LAVVAAMTYGSTRMKKIAAALLSILLTAGFVSCADHTPAGPADPTVSEPPASPLAAVPEGLVISEPRAFAYPAGLIGVTNSVSSAKISYISAAPGSFPETWTVAIRNRTRATAEVIATVINGGFDPVGVEAEANDELILTTSSPVSGLLAMVVKVPARRPPVIVRTEPARGRTDVALNVQIAVVFSEPIDKSTVTSSTLVLMKGSSEVNGLVQVSADGLTARFIPDNSLEPETTYSLVVGQAIRDLDGEPLESQSEVTFATAAVMPEAVQLLFVRWSDHQIYSIGADGNLTRLTDGGINIRPVWSPDGSRIAFARNVNDGTHNGFGSSDIYIMDANGSNVVRRTVNASFYSAAWSPDGRTIAISDEGIWYAEIYLMSADDDGTKPKLLATNARTPAWSPDGKQIAYISTSGDDGYHQVFLMNSDGTNARAITPFDGSGIFQVTWSPDGKRLAYNKCNFGECGIFTMSIDGSDVRMVLNMATADGAAWSPNGKWIAFSIDNYSGLPSIGYVRADGSGGVRVISDGAWPSWRR
jgi:dipeptidyl aminopeptidase/acylaminoacyl peptidase